MEDSEKNKESRSIAKEIYTVNGPRNMDDYKLISPHEHLLINMVHEAIQPVTEEEKDFFYGKVTMEKLGALRRNPYIVQDNLVIDNMEDSAAELGYLKDAGVDLMLDLSSVGLGRDVKKIKAISEMAGVDVMVGTGLFVHDSLPAEYSNMTVEAIAEWMIRELEVGIEDTGIRAGVIGEIGTSEKIYPIEEKSLIASAIASRHTGRPIYIHTYPWSEACCDAVQILLEHEVSPEKICVCHIDVEFHYEMLKKLLGAGVYIEFDNFGKDFYFEKADGAFAGGPFETDLERVHMLQKLIADGYGNRILCATDLCLKIMQKKYGGWGYAHVFNNVITMMKGEGISEQDIKTLLVDNPKEFLR